MEWHCRGLISLKYPRFVSGSRKTNRLKLETYAAKSFRENKKSIIDGNYIILRESLLPSSEM